MNIDIIDAWTGSVDMPWEVDDTQAHISASVNQLINPRTISKKYNQEWRDKVASELRKYRWWKKEYLDDLDLANIEIDAIDEEVFELEMQARRNKRSKLGKIVQFLDKYNLRNNHFQNDIQDQVAWLEFKKDAYQQERAMNGKWVDSYTKLPRKKLQEFYDETLCIPLSVEEKDDLLKPEVLSVLSMQEYITLWQRLNPYFLWHITRQWFRDHASWGDHNWWLEEFHQWFTSVLEDDRLIRPPISVHHGLNPHNKDSIVKFIESEIIPSSSNAEDAKKDLQSLLWSSWAVAPKYAADTSVHMAKELVAASTYGWETGNEIFYIFPSDVIASQFDFASNRSPDLRVKMHEEKWNDIFVWPSDKKSNAIPLDMWIVFLPEDARVDRNTGSKYAHTTIDWNKTMSETDENKVIVFQVLNIMREQSDENALESEFLSLMNDRGFTLWQELSADAFQAIDSYVRFTADGNIERQEELVRKVLNHTWLLWELADNTIPSRAYWESYFVANPDQKPAHVVYYQWEPTNAVNNFLIENGIKYRWDVSNLSDDPLLGFKDNHVESMDEDPRAQPGYENLIDIAHAIIDSHYS